MDYLKTNKESWNKRTEVHYDSEFYDNENFKKTGNSLNEIELQFLQDIKGRKYCIYNVILVKIVFL